MLDEAKSSPNPRRLPSEGILARSPQQPEADPTFLPDPFSQTAKPDDPQYSIRIAENPGTFCVACGKQETGAGPVGYRGDHPVCDLCLLQTSTDRGPMVATTAVVRGYAEMGGTAEEQEALTELGVFARIYHRIASKSWPARIFRLPVFVSTNDTTH